jgi:spermidine/putrescine transport system ATP-binding protein
MALVELRQVVKRFGKNEVVRSLDLAVEEGEFLTLLGPSGCGKTTTLRMIGGFEEPTSGEIRLGGHEVSRLPPYKRDVNTVFQSYALFPHLTVHGNIAYGLQQKRVPREEIDARVLEVLRIVQMEGFEGRKPRELSGGQQQRIAMARAIVNKPRVLLLDEPLGALDLKLRRQMQLELKHLHQKLGMTFIYVTHDQEEALTMSDRIAIMNRGVLEQIGSPQDIYDAPRTRFVADFIGETNLLSGVVGGTESAPVLGVEGTPVTLQPSPEARPGRNACLSIRPEQVRVQPTAPGEPHLKATVEEAVFAGSAWKVVVRLEGGARIVSSRPPAALPPLAPGANVYVSWDPERAVLLEP